MSRSLTPPEFKSRLWTCRCGVKNLPSAPACQSCRRPKPDALANAADTASAAVTGVEPASVPAAGNGLSSAPDPSRPSFFAPPARPIPPAARRTIGGLPPRTLALALGVIAVQAVVLGAVVTAYARRSPAQPANTFPAFQPPLTPVSPERLTPPPTPSAAQPAASVPAALPGTSSTPAVSPAPAASVPPGWASGYRRNSPSPNVSVPAAAPDETRQTLHPAPATGGAPGAVDPAFGPYFAWLRGVERERLDLRRTGGAGDLFYSPAPGPDAPPEPWMADPEQRQQAYTRMAEHARRAGLLEQSSVHARPPVPAGCGMFDATYSAALREETQALERIAVAVGSGEPQRIPQALQEGARAMLTRFNSAQSELDAFCRAHGARAPLTVLGASGPTGR